MKFARPSLAAAATAFTAVLLLGAFLLALLPCFSVPISARIYLFSARLPDRRVLFGLWGTCVRANGSTTCGSRTYGYGLNLGALGLPSAPGIRSRYTRASGVIIPFSAAFAFISLVTFIVHHVQAHRQASQRSFERYGERKWPKVLSISALTGVISFAFALASVACARLAFRTAQVNIDSQFPTQVAYMGNAFGLLETVPFLQAASLALLGLSIWQIRNGSEDARRRSTQKSGFETPAVGLEAAPPAGSPWQRFDDHDDAHH